MDITTLTIDLGGHEALIDRADLELVSGFKWRPLEAPNTVYALAQHKHLYIYLHRLIAGAGPKDFVDHINRNGLDNRSLNLRLCTQAQNAGNRVSDSRTRGTTSEFKGVSWNKDRSLWVAYIHLDGKTRFLGRYTEERDAANAYNDAAVKAWGEFARLNVL